MFQIFFVVLVSTKLTKNKNPRKCLFLYQIEHLPSSNIYIYINQVKNLLIKNSKIKMWTLGLCYSFLLGGNYEWFFVNLNFLIFFFRIFGGFTNFLIIHEFFSTNLEFLDFLRNFSWIFRFLQIFDVLSNFPSKNS